MKTSRIHLMRVLTICFPLELVDLTKLLVGYNEFRYGILSRPLYQTWAEGSAKVFDEKVSPTKPEEPQAYEPSTNNTAYTSGTNRWNEAANESSFLGEPGLGLQQMPMASLERKATLEYPAMFKKRKNSVVMHPTPNSGLAQPRIYNRPLQSIGNEDDEDTELPVTLKRVISRRYSISSHHSKK